MQLSDPAQLASLPDRAASWRRFLEDYAAHVYRAVERAVRDEEEARDVASDVLRSLADDWPEFVRRFRPQESPEQGARFTTWLAVVVRRRAIDALRARYGRHGERRGPRALSIDEEEGVLVPAPAGGGPRSSLARSAAHDSLTKILAKLSGDERGLLRVYFLEGVSAESLRRMTGGRTTSQVYNRVHATMQKLRTLAEEAELTADDTAALADFDWGAALSAEESGS